MQLSKIKIKNYRLLINAELDIDEKTTLIVGRNNTAKTSCLTCIMSVLNGKPFTYNDYPLLKREELYKLLSAFMGKRITYAELCQQLEVISIEFLVDYSLDDSDALLGALSPFIIDVDVDTTTTLIRVEYQLKMDEKGLVIALRKATIQMVFLSQTWKASMMFWQRILAKCLLSQYML